MFFFLSIIIISLYDLFAHKNMSISTSQSNLGTSYGFLNLNQRSFKFALKFQNSALNDWKNLYFNISLYHVTQFRNSSLVYKIKNQISMRPCNKIDYGDLSNEFMKLKLNEALCPEENSNLTLQGNYQENIYSYFQISIDDCNDATACQNATSLKNILANSGFIINFYDYFK